MHNETAIMALAALAQVTRLEAFRLLVKSEPDGIAAGELARQLAVPQNTLSSHLNVLAHAGLVRGERHSRSIVYRADLGRFRDMTLFLVKDCCGGRAELCDRLLRSCRAALPRKRRERRPRMPDRIYNVLFLCTGNSARSIMAEGLLNKLGEGRFRAFSAGSHPKGGVHPLALEQLREAGVSTEGLRSKSWDEFTVPGAPELDFVFTVCDNAAGEECPFWPGQPMTAHWGIEDPAAAEGTKIERVRAFVEAMRYLRNRIAQFTSLRLKHLDEMSLRSQLREIGQQPGASMPRPDVA